MDKKLEMDFFKVFDTGGVLWNCFELIDKKYDLGEQKREGRKELSKIEQRLNDEILQHIKNRRSLLIEITQLLLQLTR